jgi:hypothetical protein
VSNHPLIWEPPLAQEPNPGTHDHIAYVRIADQRGFTVEVHGASKTWFWSVWRHTRTREDEEDESGFAKGKATSKLDAAARAQEALTTMRHHFGL